MTQFDYAYLREIVAEIKPLPHARLTSETTTNCVISLTWVQPRARRPPLSHCKQGLASHADNVSSSRVIVCQGPHTGICPISGYQILPTLATETTRVDVEGTDDRTPKRKKKKVQVGCAIEHSRSDPFISITKVSGTHSPLAMLS